MRNQLCRVIKAIFLLSIGFVMIACDTGLDGTEGVDQEQIRKKARLEELSQKIVGLYRGDMSHVDGQVYPVEVRIFSVLEKVGLDDDGQAQTLPVNYGQIRFQQFTYDEDLQNYNVVLTSDGKLEMVYSPTAGADDSGIKLQQRTVKGKWSEGAIKNATWTGENGDIGILSVNRVSKEIPQVDSKELRERRLKQFRPVQNLFRGKLYDFEGKYFDDLEIEFFVADVNASGEYLLSLLASFKTENSSLLQAYPKALVDWDPRTKIFRFAAKKGNGTVSVSGLLDKDGFLQVDSFVVSAKPFEFK